MSEKTRFYNMTKPVRFRRLKQAKMMIVLWCKALRERTIYLFNYLLYKLKILKRKQQSMRKIMIIIQEQDVSGLEDN